MSQFFVFCRYFRFGNKIWYFKWGMKTLLCLLNSVLSMNEQNFFYKKSHQRRGMKSGEYGTSLKIVREVFLTWKAGVSRQNRESWHACKSFIVSSFNINPFNPVGLFLYPFKSWEKLRKKPVTRNRRIIIVRFALPCIQVLV